MTGPSAALNSSPASRAPIKIDQMELAPIPLGVIQQKAVQHILRIRMRDVFSQDFIFQLFFFLKTPFVVFDHAGSWTRFELKGQNAAKRINQLQMQQSFSAANMVIIGWLLGLK